MEVIWATRLVMKNEIRPNGGQGIYSNVGKNKRKSCKQKKNGSVKKTDCIKKEHQPVVGLRGLKIDTGIEGDHGTRQRT